jgi:nucleoside-diphosphate-sugar epimerase
MALAEILFVKNISEHLCFWQMQVYTYIIGNKGDENMRIFVTGASGYVGSVVTEKAVKSGHQVVGLARSESSAAKVKKLGAQPLLGTLDNLDLLKKAAQEADAVLHIGFVHEFDRPYDQLLAIDVAAIKTMSAGLLGSNKPLIATTATGIIQPNNGQETTEDSPITESPLGARYVSERATLDFVKDGVRSMVIRLAPYVYGRGGSYFVPALIQATAKYGFAPYIGDGLHMTTAADVDAAADLYLLAMEKGKAGSTFNCSTETDVRFVDLAKSVAAAFNVEAKSVTGEKADEMCGPFTGMLMRLENRASSEKARRELGWKPVPNLRLFEDIVRGSYRPLVDKLKSEAAVAR